MSRLIKKYTHLQERASSTPSPTETTHLLSVPEAGYGNTRNAQQDGTSQRTRPDGITVVDMDKKNEQGEGKGKKESRLVQLMTAQYNYQHKIRERNDVVRLRVVLLFANVLVSVGIACAVLEIEFGNRVGVYGGTAPESCVDAEHGCLFSSWITDVLKCIISALTVVSICQHWELLRKRVSNRVEQLRDEQELRDTMGAKTNLTPAQMRRMRLMRSPLFSSVYEHYREKSDYFVMFLSVPHLFPFVGTSMDKYLILFMFWRFYWALEVLRVFDATYCLRYLAFRSTFHYNKRVPKPKLSVGATLRIFFHNYPTTAVLIFILVGELYCSYGLFIFEREANYPGYSFGGGLFCSAVSMLCGYPADPYDTYTPKTWPGKFMCLLATAWGLFLFAILIETMDSRMRLDKYEIAAAHWVQAFLLQQELRTSSARLIQTAWRRYRWEGTCETLADDDPRYLRQVAMFERKVASLIMQLRDLRRRQIRLPDSETQGGPEAQPVEHKGLSRSSSCDSFVRRAPSFENLNSVGSQPTQAQQQVAPNPLRRPNRPLYSDSMEVFVLRDHDLPGTQTSQSTDSLPKIDTKQRVRITSAPVTLTASSNQKAATEQGKEQGKELGKRYSEEEIVGIVERAVERALARARSEWVGELDGLLEKYVESEGGLVMVPPRKGKEGGI